ncbi:MAG: hypothetical protein M5R42_01415 [Rhodocyclaceae bacterium]|nr:hypothetical protein [Rhodocyclaceae bacterium]
MSIESKKIDYKFAGKLPCWNPDLTSPSRDERHAVPDISPHDLQPIPPTVQSALVSKDAAVQEVLPQMVKDGRESGSQRWLVVAGTPRAKSRSDAQGILQELDSSSIWNCRMRHPENRLRGEPAKLPQDMIRATLGKFRSNLLTPNGTVPNPPGKGAE